MQIKLSKEIVEISQYVTALIVNVIWNDYVNNFKKPMAQQILKNYKDIDDKANQAIGVGKEEGKKKGVSAFSGRKSLADMVNDILDSED